jgi:hypothetical protein
MVAPHLSTSIASHMGYCRYPKTTQNPPQCPICVSVYRKGILHVMAGVDGGDVVDAGAPFILLVLRVEPDEVLLRMAGDLQHFSASRVRKCTHQRTHGITETNRMH